MTTIAIPFRLIPRGSGTVGRTLPCAAPACGVPVFVARPPSTDAATFVYPAASEIRCEAHR